MKSVITKVLVLMLVACMLLPALVACKTGGDKTTATPTTGGAVTAKDPYAGMSHADVSDALYEKVLGEFNKYYQQAVAASSVSERFALMAIAEAKLMQSGIMLPSTANGGRYAISRVVPYTVTPVLYGNDSDRFHQIIALAGDQAPFTPTQRDELRALWKNAATSAEYEAAVKAYLTEKGLTTTDHYAIGYTSDPNTWDVLDTYQAADTEAIVNTYDGLLEFDLKGNAAYALATNMVVSEDGLTYTFTIRQGVKWVDFTGREVADLTAQDFVSGMHHMLDAQGGLESLVFGIIKNAEEYVAGEVTDFSQVGVKATDDHTLVYTLAAPCTYFDTMLGYSIFAPMNAEYFVSKGGAFGVEAFDEAKGKETYTYGTSQENIAYCGPYLVSSAVKEQTIVFDANPSYWNKDGINVKKITWNFIDGTNTTEVYDGMITGTYSSAALGSDALQKAKTTKVPGTDKSYFDTYAYTSSLDANSYPIFFNLYRQQYANFNDASVAVSSMTEDQKLRANLAMQNNHFRLALAFGLDRGAFNAVTNGDDLKYVSLVNSYTPGNFVSLHEDVTVKINGKDTTFKAGTYYGAIMQAQIDADGGKMKVWDPTLEGGIGSSTGFDGWYSVENAVAELNAAIEELAAIGVVIDESNPIVLEMPYYDIYTPYANRSNVLKQSIEASLGGKVKINLVKTGGSNALNWYNAGYYPQSGDKMNYNLTDICGWGPDYGDPSTYLNTMLPIGGGMTKNIGLY